MSNLSEAFERILGKNILMIEVIMHVAHMQVLAKRLQSWCLRAGEMLELRLFAQGVQSSVSFRHYTIHSALNAVHSDSSSTSPIV